MQHRARVRVIGKRHSVHSCLCTLMTNDKGEEDGDNCVKYCCWTKQPVSYWGRVLMGQWRRIQLWDQTVFLIAISKLTDCYFNWRPHRVSKVQCKKEHFKNSGFKLEHSHCGFPHCGTNKELRFFASWLWGDWKRHQGQGLRPLVEIVTNETSVRGLSVNGYNSSSLVIWCTTQ